jgi:AraC-like DNA-binding protein
METSVTDRENASRGPFPGEPQPPSYRFSTEDLPESDRLAIFREIVGRQMLRQEMEPLPDHRFHIHGTARRLPGGPFLLRCAGSPQRARRTRHLLSDGDDSLFFQWTKSTRYAEHLGREIALGPGDAVLFSCSEPRSITLPSRFEAITIKVPRNALGPLLREANSCFARPIPANSGALTLLIRYLEALSEESSTETPELQELAAAHVYDLLAIVLGATPDAAETGRRRGVRAARLQAIKTDIGEKLWDEGLSVTGLASRHRMTPRSVQMLFEEAGTTFTEFLREQRLSRAHRMLMSRRFDDQRVIDVAFACGFGDISYFNRTFHARYGAAPSDIRAVRAKSVDRIGAERDL